MKENGTIYASVKKNSLGGFCTLKKIQYYLFIAIFILGFILVGRSFAESGDILFQCNFDTGGSTASSVWSSCDGNPTKAVDSEIIDTNCVSGRCVETTLETSYGAYREVWGPFIKERNYGNEVTVVYWEKFSKTNPHMSNTKSLRILTNGGYIGGLVSNNNKMAGDDSSNIFYQSWWQYCNPVTFGSGVSIDPYRCKSNGNGTYDCSSTGTIVISFQPDFGDGKWHKIRYYQKNPSNSTSKDGRFQLWIDEKFMYRSDGVGNSEVTGPNIESIVWEPSLGGSESFSHYYDEIVVYEGYVSPSGDFEPPPSGKVPNSASGINISD